VEEFDAPGATSGGVVCEFSAGAGVAVPVVESSANAIVPGATKARPKNAAAMDIFFMSFSLSY